MVRFDGLLRKMEDVRYGLEYGKLNEEQIDLIMSLAQEITHECKDAKYTLRYGDQ